MSWIDSPEAALVFAAAVVTATVLLSAAWLRLRAMGASGVGPPARAPDYVPEYVQAGFVGRLDALLLVGDREHVLVVSGNGDVIEPDDGIAAIGSGGSFALAAARALARHTDLEAEKIAREALLLAAEICIYTNDRATVVTLP